MKIYKVFRTESPYIDRDDQSRARDFASHVEVDTYEELFEHSKALLDEADRAWGNLDHRLGHHYVFIWLPSEPSKAIRLQAFGIQSTAVLDEETFEVDDV